MNNTAIGILAHVDAGKTTLSESILYRTGTIRRRGRVDHGDAFLDTDETEKKRGITIYSKLARFEYRGRPFTILDTPGHADFSPEMERTLRVLDAAVLVVSAADLIAQDGADPQVRTLWNLLAHYDVPTFVFINKMDQQRDGARNEEDLQRRLFHLLEKDLGSGLVPFGEDQLCGENEEAVAVCDDALMERILEGGRLTDADVAQMMAARKVFPVYFGSALNDEGTEELLAGIGRYTCPFGGGREKASASLAGNAGDAVWAAKQIRAKGSESPAGSTSENRNEAAGSGSADRFGAIVYKITREDGVRLTWMKITSGRLSIRDSVTEQISGGSCAASGAEALGDSGILRPEEEEGAGAGTTVSSGMTEKVTEIRLYSGERFQAVTCAGAGEIAAVAGLSYTRPGDGLGVMEAHRDELLTPIMTSSVTAEDMFGRKADNFTLMKALRALAEQEPILQPEQNEDTGDITVRIMGQVQTEIMREQLRDRYKLRATFGSGTIVYKETIRREVEGVGHFEPLRHYAEVHLLLEPGGPGSGITLEDRCAPDTLERNWRSLILTHLAEKEHKGVLTGSALTDVRICVIGGRASRKHTSGGDFRKATYAAVRQGLMSAENILLEPVLSFRMELPADQIGRAMSDISRMAGSVRPAEIHDENAVLEGSVPASEFGDYAQTLAGYTGGRGQLGVSLKGYEPCHNAREVIDRIGYDPDTDPRNTADSVFCSHGAGTVVPWDRVREFMHVDTGWTPPKDDGPYLTDDYYTFTGESREPLEMDREEEDPDAFKKRQQAFYAGEAELQRIFERTYGPVKRHVRHPENEKYFDREETDSENTGAGSAAGPDGKEPGGSPAVSGGGDPEKKKHAVKGRKEERQEFLLVDGYNIIYAWEDLKELADVNIASARGRLLDILSDYAGYSGLIVIVVFDAYRVPGGKGEILRYHNIDVVFTKEAETADLYIEKTAHKLSKQHRVTVATGDYVEQVIIFGAGAYRLSPRGLLEAILYAKKDMRERFLN